MGRRGKRGWEDWPRITTPSVLPQVSSAAEHNFIPGLEHQAVCIQSQMDHHKTKQKLSTIEPRCTAVYLELHRGVVFAPSSMRQRVQGSVCICSAWWMHSLLVFYGDLVFHANQTAGHHPSARRITNAPLHSLPGSSFAITSLRVASSLARSIIGMWLFQPHHMHRSASPLSRRTGRLSPLPTPRSGPAKLGRTTPKAAFPSMPNIDPRHALFLAQQQLKQQQKHLIRVSSRVTCIPPDGSRGSLVAPCRQADEA